MDSTYDGNNDRVLFIAGLPDLIKETELAGIFSTFGEIRSVHIPREIESGKARGYAFLEFEELEDAEHAIMNYDNTEIMGKVIKVKKSDGKKKGQNQAIWHEEEVERKRLEEQEKERMENELKEKEAQRKKNYKEKKASYPKKQF